jgi:hypothetical protein
VIRSNSLSFMPTMSRMLYFADVAEDEFIVPFTDGGW